MERNQLQSFFLTLPNVTQDTEHLFDRISQFQEIMMMYRPSRQR